MRKSQTFHLDAVQIFKDRLLTWSQRHDQVVWLDNNGHNDPYGSFEAIMAIGSVKSKKTEIEAFDTLEKRLTHHQDWLFGYFSYDLKNKLEDLKSINYDGLHFPELYFFIPTKVIKITADTVAFLYQNEVAHEIGKDYNAIVNSDTAPIQKNSNQEPIKIKMRIHKDAYFKKANKFLEHIQRGDIYEANFCQEFYAENTTISPLPTYRRLNEISSPPFAAFMKLKDLYLLSASPERYLKKIKNKVISQPIKGTAARSTDKAQDIILKTLLANDAKERAENIMITDLVRNDLSRFANKGSVKVEELCNIHSFKQVHQMISTITCTINDDQNPLVPIKQTFPMGSMTGAPKVSAMKIIEALEETKRGLYSGAVGYFDPEGNFDFNVVIRSILYNATKKYVSYSVGSAITAKSNPEKEYQECLLKAKAMREVLTD